MLFKKKVCDTQTIATAKVDCNTLVKLVRFPFNQKEKWQIIIFDKNLKKRVDAVHVYERSDLANEHFYRLVKKLVRRRWQQESDRKRSESYNRRPHEVPQ